MKPYFLVIHNKLKFVFKKLKTPNISIKGIQLLGWNTKIKMAAHSNVIICDKMTSDGRFVIIADNGAKLSIGKNVYFNEGGMISCKGQIIIGDGCKFGPNVKIFDNNHRFDAVNGVSNEHNYGTIEIGENCWIGANCVLLKGAKVGKNSVIGAGCVINCDIPEASIVTQGRELIIKEMRR